MNEFETNDADADAFLDKSQEGHTWASDGIDICGKYVPHLKPIQSNSTQSNRIELNYVYRYSCKSVQFAAALHIPVAHTSHL